MENPLQKLAEAGQSLWLDNLERRMVSEGRLKDFLEKDDVRGLTSNPVIFHKAITGSDAYDEDIANLAKAGKSAEEIYESLAIADIRAAADTFSEVYRSTGGGDGFVSLEVSPHLAKDAEATLAEARRLWKDVDRPNLMIKIPGTKEGLMAIEEALFEGINVNITLLFSVNRYREVMEVHQRAMRRRKEADKPLEGVSSVASFFLSRIDSKIDPTLDKMEGEKSKGIRGLAAVANAKMAYQAWKKMYSGSEWKDVERAGARKQRPLWASTSTKDKTYSDVKYVEPLIGLETVNTMPEETVDAFRDHGRVAVTVENEQEKYREALSALEDLGISMEDVASELVEEGVEKFVRPFDELLASIDEKRKKFAA